MRIFLGVLSHSKLLFGAQELDLLKARESAAKTKALWLTIHYIDIINIIFIIIIIIIIIIIFIIIVIIIIIIII